MKNQNIHKYKIKKKENKLINDRKRNKTQNT